MNPADYPSREKALRLIEALASDAWSSPSELDALAGVENLGSAAEACFMVYGYPELDAGRVARRVAEVSARPSPGSRNKPPEARAGALPEMDAPHSVDDDDLLYWQAAGSPRIS